MTSKKNKLYPRVILLFWILFFVALLDRAETANPLKDQNFSGVAKVNGRQIVRTEFEKKLRYVKNVYRAKKDTLTPEKIIWLKTHTLNQMIRDELLIQEAKKLKVKLNREEYEKTLADMREDESPDSTQTYVKLQGMTVSEWENEVKNLLLIKKLIEQVVDSKVTVGEDELADYFENHPEEFLKGEEIRALHIMVETETEARKLLAQLKKKKGDFKELARLNSRGPEGARGGDLGYFEKGQMPEEFDSLFDLKKGALSEVIFTPHGYHIFKVVDKRPERKMKFPESKKNIFKKMVLERQGKAFKDWLLGIKNKADIKINYATLEQIN